MNFYLGILICSVAFHDFHVLRKRVYWLEFAQFLAIYTRAGSGSVFIDIFTFIFPPLGTFSCKTLKMGWKRRSCSYPSKLFSQPYSYFRLQIHHVESAVNYFPILILISGCRSTLLSGVNYFPNLVLISGCRYTLLSGVNYFPNLVLFSGCRFTLLSAVFVDLKYNKVKLPVDEVLRMVMIQLQVSC